MASEGAAPERAGAEQEDRELLARARLGDRAAFGELARRHRGAVYRFARRLAGAGLAEDLLQETFLTALRQAGQYRGEGSVRGWLLAIARSRALLARRRRAGEPAAYESVEALEALGLEAGWGQPSSPEELASRLEQQAALEAALAGLDEAEREVLLLRDVEGLSGEETAAALGLGLAAMKSRLHRARLRLLAALKQGGPP